MTIRSKKLTCLGPYNQSSWLRPSSRFINKVEAKDRANSHLTTLNLSKLGVLFACVCMCKMTASISFYPHEVVRTRLREEQTKDRYRLEITNISKIVLLTHTFKFANIHWRLIFFIIAFLGANLGKLRRTISQNSFAADRIRVNLQKFYFLDEVR